MPFAAKKLLQACSKRSFRFRGNGNACTLVKTLTNPNESEPLESEPVTFARLACILNSIWEEAMGEDDSLVRYLHVVEGHVFRNLGNVQWDLKLQNLLPGPACIRRQALRHPVGMVRGS